MLVHLLKMLFVIETVCTVGQNNDSVLLKVQVDDTVFQQQKISSCHCIISTGQVYFTQIISAAA